MEENLHLDQHISHKYNQELEHLREHVLEMGGLVESQCRDAIAALLTGDVRLAQKVATSDHRINEFEVNINSECTEVMARRQPAASDLRLVISIIRMASNLERIGDEAEKIGRLAEKLAEKFEKHSFYTEPSHLGERAVEMLHRALDAFTRLDVGTAIEVAGMDPELDADVESLTRLLITHMMEQPRDVKSMLRVNWCARALERIGDHAVNICEEVIFLVKGSDVRHISLDEIKSRYMPGGVSDGV